jgi:hypothetical protein
MAVSDTPITAVKGFIALAPRDKEISKSEARKKYYEDNLILVNKAPFSDQLSGLTFK